MTMAVCAGCGHRTLCVRTQPETKDVQGREQCEYHCTTCLNIDPSEGPKSGAFEILPEPDDIPFW